jgi:LacI family transcriptional regulator
MRTTIKDVARIAGVSIATVSRVINHTDYGVDRALQDRVWAAVKETNYRPNQIAKSMVTNKTNTIAVLSPDVLNPFYHDIIVGMNEVALKQQYSLLMYNTNGDLENEKANLDLIFSRSVDGVILIGLFEDKVRQLVRQFAGIPVVVLDEIEDLDEVGQVYVDDERAIEQMVSYLISQGHRRIGCIIGSKQYAIIRKRLAGYQKALQKAKIPYDEAFVVMGELTEESAMEPAKELIRQQVSAIVCFNDLMAYGVYHKCMELGVRIPQDLSVVGFDGIQFSEYLNPPLTTCYQPGLEMGRQAMTLVLDKVDGKERRDEKICLACELRIRSSVQKVE